MVFEISPRCFNRYDSWATCFNSPYGIGAGVGVGHLIVIKVERLVSLDPPPLWRAAMRAPEYFARYDIYADRNTLIFPDAERLNSLATNGIKFVDIPRFEKQFYTDEYFNKTVRTNRIPLASRDERDPYKFDDPFHHDHLEEHLLGAIVLPSWLLQQFFAYAKINPGGSWWDSMTSDFGDLAEDIAGAGDRGGYLTEILTVKMKLWQSRFGFDERSDAQITEDAILTVREISGMAPQEIRENWRKFKTRPAN